MSITGTQMDALARIYSGYIVRIALFKLQDDNYDLQDVKPLRSMQHNDSKTLLRSGTDTHRMERSTEVQRATSSQRTGSEPGQSAQSAQSAQTDYHTASRESEGNTHTASEYQSDSELAMIEQTIQAFRHDTSMIQKETEHQDAQGHLLNNDTVQSTLGMSSYDQFEVRKHAEDLSRHYRYVSGQYQTFYAENEVIFRREGERHTHCIAYTLFEHTIYMFERTIFLLEILRNDFAKDFAGPDSISTTGHRTHDRYIRKEYIGTRTRTQKDRKSALERIDPHMDLPNEQRIGSIHSGLQAALLRIQTGHFIETYMEQRSIQTVTALRKVENATWTFCDRTSHHETLKVYSDDSGIESVDLRRHERVETQGNSMRIQQDIHRALRYRAYTHISSDIRLIHQDLIEFKDGYYTLGCTPQLVFGHRAQQDIQFCITVGYCTQKSTHLEIFYQYERKALHSQELVYWKNRGHSRGILEYISAIYYCMTILQEQEFAQGQLEAATLIHSIEEEGYSFVDQGFTSALPEDAGEENICNYHAAGISTSVHIDLHRASQNTQEPKRHISSGTPPIPFEKCLSHGLEPCYPPSGTPPPSQYSPDRLRISSERQ
ncbi:uncharacterized protein FOMMEDRAFT_159208 [Fomitiporia mediterranea MF3/22]|uniref:uncharacterized protein n=1 Tax=Fomitiporia mediterranea (strain MF3/22) TaxID=694068 RepID=UPI000440785F|nr:uncharacterized protein FOMMEDRAFT_159208 [Fomitiporia mediterranea MF3/22]EJD00499.1 hypothetical protein FOMMEDRAFT_159208 [Fomitiporia mediterranea MF3/22]